MFRIKSGNIFVCKFYFSFLFFYSADLNLQMHKGADLNPDPQHWVQLLISGLQKSTFKFFIYCVVYGILLLLKNWLVFCVAI